MEIFFYSWRSFKAFKEALVEIVVRKGWKEKYSFIDVMFHLNLLTVLALSNKGSQQIPVCCNFLQRTSSTTIEAL